MQDVWKVSVSYGNGSYRSVCTTKAEAYRALEEWKDSLPNPTTYTLEVNGFLDTAQKEVCVLASKRDEVVAVSINMM
jgi:hypothetical protein